ncbi:DUF4957 domain-containing protein [Candidatus Poribacteria bacterium]|nr:DUF4957 domain-containing protein [Candidatus Poribacteria bacterium]
MINTIFMVLLCIITTATTAVSRENETLVHNTSELNQALTQAKPGHNILITPGNYEGGIYIQELNGDLDKTIVIDAADPEKKPVIQGGGNCIHIAEASYLEIRNLILSGATGNGLNIDDGGTYETPAHHILLHGLTVRDIGPEGNRDGIKLSGVDEFKVKECFVERWGSGGSGIDMVGCHKGVIEDCTFRHGDDKGSNAIQIKGGSKDITIQSCRFEHAGSRAVNIGGSTGLQFFRPDPQGYEAKDITVEGCSFIGSMAPVAFVGVDGALVRYNKIYRPRKWIMRILQETRGPEFVPCRNGKFINNIVVFRSDEVSNTVNIGPKTAPETFTFAGNLWYCMDDVDKSKPVLPAPESNGIYGKDPQFCDPEKGDLRLKDGSPVSWNISLFKEN